MGTAARKASLSRAMNEMRAVPGERRRRPKSLEIVFPQLGNGRRSHRRYPVDLSMRCKLCGTDRVVPGRVRDISSTGVQFVSSEVFPPAIKVELLIDWPVLLNGNCRLQLRGYGKIVRSDAAGT